MTENQNPNSLTQDNFLRGFQNIEVYGEKFNWFVLSTNLKWVENCNHISDFKKEKGMKL